MTIKLCRYCNQKIDWATVNGKPTPVEPEEVAYDDCDAGDYLVTKGGKLIRVDGFQSFPTLQGRLSHVNRCRKSPSNVATFNLLEEMEDD